MELRSVAGKKGIPVKSMASGFGVGGVSQQLAGSWIRRHSLGSSEKAKAQARLAAEATAPLTEMLSLVSEGGVGG